MKYRSPLALLTLSLLLIGTMAACRTTNEAADEVQDEAQDVIGNVDALVGRVQDTDGPGTVSGRVRFTEDGGEIQVGGNVNGLSPGEHGFHVHENGSCAAQDGTPAGAAGGHYNPDGTPHGDPSSQISDHHAGDFGNITAGSDGTADISLSYAQGDHELSEYEGKALIIHNGTDDLESQPSGAAGARVGCALLMDPDDMEDMEQ